MLATLLLLAFLGFMVYWFGFVQGFFSAFLHLMVVIVAGALVRNKRKPRPGSGGGGLPGGLR